MPCFLVIIKYMVRSGQIQKLDWKQREKLFLINNKLFTNPFLLILILKIGILVTHSAGGGPPPNLRKSSRNSTIFLNFNNPNYNLITKYIKLMKKQHQKKKTSLGKIPSEWNLQLAASTNKLRGSELKFDQRSSDLYLLRNSYSSIGFRNYTQPQPNQLRLSNMNPIKKARFQNLMSTLDKLEDRVNETKSQLQISKSQKKKKQQVFIHYDQEEENTYEEKQQIISPSESHITLKNSDKKLASLISTIPKPANFKPIYSNPYSPRRHCTYYISQAIRGVNQNNSLIRQHINATLTIFRQTHFCHVPQLSQMADRKLNLKKKEIYAKKKTLVLDLDQTLIHCVEKYDSEAELRLSLKIQDDDNRKHHFGINIRPYAITFLKKMSKKFQIIIFTASQQQYADAILDQLDPDNQIFQHRLYRQHCYVIENQYHVKDLRVINRNLSQMVLVDNAPYSYIFQLQNGIPILPFYEGSDFELAALQSYLDQIQKSPDVRELNKKTFKLHQYIKFESGKEVIEKLYMNSH